MNLCVDSTISLAPYLLLPQITIPATLSTSREPGRSERPCCTSRNQNGSIHERQSEVGQDCILLAGFQPAFLRLSSPVGEAPMKSARSLQTFPTGPRAARK